VDLLGGERPENSPMAKWITSRLYIGDEDTRLAQYMLLGIGGAKALEAMGIQKSNGDPQAGKAALAWLGTPPMGISRPFSDLDRTRRTYSGNGSIKAALEIAQKRTVSPTHTPVPAGN